MHLQGVHIDSKFILWCLCRCVFEQTSRLTVNIPLFASKAEEIILSTYSKHYASARQTDEQVVRELLSRNPEKFERSRALSEPRAHGDSGGESHGTGTTTAAADCAANRQDSVASVPNELPSFSLPVPVPPVLHASTSVPHIQTSSTTTINRSSSGFGSEEEDESKRTESGSNCGERPLTPTCARRGPGRPSLSKSSNADGTTRQVVVAAEKAFASYKVTHVSHPPCTKEMEAILKNPDMPSVMHGYVARVIFKEHSVTFDEQHFIRFGVFPVDAKVCRVVRVCIDQRSY